MTSSRSVHRDSMPSATGDPLVPRLPSARRHQSEDRNRTFRRFGTVFERPSNGPGSRTTERRFNRRRRPHQGNDRSPSFRLRIGSSPPPEARRSRLRGRSRRASSHHSGGRCPSMLKSADAESVGSLGETGRNPQRACSPASSSPIARRSDWTAEDRRRRRRPNRPHIERAFLRMPAGVEPRSTPRTDLLQLSCTKRMSSRRLGRLDQVSRKNPVVAVNSRLDHFTGISRS